MNDTRKKFSIKNIKNIKNIKFKTLLNSNLLEKSSPNMAIFTQKNRSFSPSINKRLSVKSLKSLQPNKISFCKDLLKLRINKTKKCLNYKDKKVKKFLLHNLKATKQLDPKLFIAPKQLLGNCWFNTMFVTFFFSDKGRKFFRFFREYMIKGEKIDKTKINDEKLAKMFFILNLYIEASYNQTSTNQNKKNILYNQLLPYLDNLHTNYFIKEIHDTINHKIYNKVPDLNEAGNPIQFYKTIMSYLNYDILKLMEINIQYKENIKYYLKQKFLNYYKIPDIIILNDFESKSFYDKYYNLYQNGIKYTYKLDAIIITNKGHFKPKANSHFVSLLTINNEEYKFDGDSYSRLTNFKWKQLINKNKDWYFNENPNYYPEKYNFQYGYKMLFYYRS
tara:strand:- start:100 stop:1272 length:1173 start_codon:yes stop_codon:yes gene_type:complete